MIIQSLRQGVKRIKVSKSKQKKQKLTDLQIVKLAKICLNIERHYKKAQDIEWAFEKGKFYIIQARPVTAL